MAMPAADIGRKRNLALPATFALPVGPAWRELVKLGLREPEKADQPRPVSSIIGALAIGEEQLSLGRLAFTFMEDERQGMLEAIGWT
jgi:hypothetical protein